MDREAVVYEGLFHYPERKRRRVLEREGGELRLQRGLGGLSGTRELLTSRTLALSAARRFDEPLVSRFAAELLAAQPMGVPATSLRRRGYATGRSTAKWFDDHVDRDQLAIPETPAPPGRGQRDREQALALLQLADLGIDDVVVDDEDVAFGGSAVGETTVRTRRRVRLIHRTSTGKVPLDFAAESEGTRTWFGVIGPVLSAVRSGSLLLFDELDASLHPTLSAELIRLFHDPGTNPRGAQLVFTSHDTSLLNHLNRDEVWLTEKDDNGVTHLGALAEFAGERVRRSQNLEKAYLHGRFGALPDVDRTEMLRALGLVG